ncbi:MAG: acetate--CoA ligase family protein [Acidobacteria bacterium]|nr:acetate--CoA ligase family protein [Acidobacteriota bacterium]
MRDFESKPVRVLNGSNRYMNCPAWVFTLAVPPELRGADRFAPALHGLFPPLAQRECANTGELFAEALLHVLRMDMDLYLRDRSVAEVPEGYEIAVAFFDERVTEDAVDALSDLFRDLAERREPRRFAEDWKRLQADFDRTLFGGPTLYSLIEAGLKRGIPVHYLWEENQFMWGYGVRQVRGRSTTFSVDGIKDTEFTMYKDMVKEFLLMCGFPTPIGKNCFHEDEIVEQAEALGYPVVVKPVAGHKGQGVTTGVRSADEVRQAFWNIKEQAKEAGVYFDGAIVEQQVEGTDHRLLSVKGKFVAALQRVPAYVDGNGADTIETLIEKENATVARIDNARSPLCKIKVDENLVEFLTLQGMNLRTVPDAGQRVFLRRVANISAGGVSINVTPAIHPKNVKMVEDIARFFNVTCLGIDVLCKDISKPWDEGNFGIIEINAGPGIFMHLVPAIGPSIDVPGAIIRAHFPEDGSDRVPIVAGNRITPEMACRIRQIVSRQSPGTGFGSLTEEGIAFDGSLFFKGTSHHQNVKVVLRNPRTAFAVFSHPKEKILASGMFHHGADLVILDNPAPEEEILARDLLPGGILVDIRENKARVLRNGEEEAHFKLPSGDDRDGKLVERLEDRFVELIGKYDR